ncbi:TPA: UvrY/SirA/GacA family response regulator transcription factor [Escherichia coli]|nr:UvrY/SirA/GacA family response regulator transcription factor [Escherichia coli]WBZ25690.1 UvrY/SirA/GacA family response regulator transcription factor [Escherichia coli]HCY2061249.1 UvrY/SirA/GacA family response regulator transcription factor [Escherichia coli]HCY2239258.1 UvrY/SirA/GacA family response regulator transcription factor [Escherichia coli]HCY2248674.1 UvrY/SirA/GacA family response regulator transcription factor [Escherichia coli]HCY2583653.1 UvrY/SirA/GacA family response r
MPLHNLTRFPRLEFIGAPTPLEYLPRFSDYLGREIFIKRDDVTPMAMGGNKLRKLEFLAADALREGADTLITAGAIQSNHVRQTAAVAAKLGLHCVALLENPIGTTAENYLTNGNRLLLDLFNTQIEMCDALTDPNAQLEELATRVEAQGFRPYVIPVGGSNALGALGYVESALEIAQQCEGAVNISSVVVASGSAGTHAGLAVGLEHLMPESELIGVTVSRSVADQIARSTADVKIIMLTVHTENPLPAKVMQAGAAGYLSKGAAPQEVVSAIRSVYSGQRYIASDIAQQMALSQIEPEKTESPFASLSERELQIMLMITKGQKVNEISEQLNLSPKTVNSYRYRMFSKLNIHGDVELTHLAIRHGLCNAETLSSQ